MKKDDFYLCLNILNILLFFYMFGIMVCCFIVFSIAENPIVPNCTVILCVLAKSLCLPFLFAITERFFSNSRFSNVVKELKNNTSKKIQALFLSFGYDIIILLYYTLQEIKAERFNGIAFEAYETVTLGGICMFYIALFGIWKIQDKLKKKCQ